MSFKDFFSSKFRVKNNQNLKTMSSELLNCLDNSNFFKSLSREEQQSLKKSAFSEDLQEVYRKQKVEDFKPTKSAKEIFYHFFGMNENWKLGRNIGGIVMVHCPEYPTYFIPTYSQTSQTGNPGHVKKGEVARGLITGGLEGIAVGALVSGEILKPKEMVPYIILGAGLQFLSSTLFPWLGEVVGRQVYNHRVATGKIDPSKPNIEPVSHKKVKKPKNPSFSGANPYRNVYSSGLKI